MARTTARRRTTRRRPGTPSSTGTRGRRTSTAALLVAGLLVTAGCATGTEPADQGTSAMSSTTSSPSATSAPAAAGTTDGAWTLMQAEVDGAQLTLVESVPVTLLVEDGRASGSAACNTYTTSVDTADGGWRISGAAVTRMACEAELMTLETAYLDALARVDTADVADGTLTLTGPDVRLVFSHDTSAEEDAG